MPAHYVVDATINYIQVLCFFCYVFVLGLSLRYYCTVVACWGFRMFSVR